MEAIHSVRFRPNPNPHSIAPNPIIEPPRDCEVKYACRSCAFVNDDYKEGLKFKYDRGMSILAGTGLMKKVPAMEPVPAPLELRYRAIAKLAVRDVAGKVVMGLFAPSTHKVVDIDGCPVHVGSIRRLLPDLREEIEFMEVRGYDEATLTGELRYVVIRASHRTNELQITFVARTAIERNKFLQMVSNLRRRGHRVVAAHLNINPDSTNAIFGAETVKVWGIDTLRERLCGLDFEVGPLSFFQVNPWMAEIIYRRITALAEPRKGKPIAWDLYSGVGQISLQLARNGYDVLGIEEISAASEDARRNALINNLSDRCEFITTKTEELLARVPDRFKIPELIVANPSRRGLAKDAVAGIAHTLKLTRGSRFIYMSCDVTTLARDIALLAEHGIKLRQVEAFDMFPQTMNLEWLATFTI